jgi:hypothetical protein
VRPVTQTFLDTVRGSHQAMFRARLLPYGSTGVSPPDGTEITINAGNIIFDTKSDVNATLELFVDYGWPSSDADPIAPYGNEVFVERGVRYGEGAREWVALGYFRIDAIEQDYRKGQIRITGTDRMSRVRDYRPTAPENFVVGTSVEDIVNTVVGDAVPGLVALFDWDAGSTVISSDHVLSEDRIKFLRELLTAYGKIFYFDYAGRLIVRDQPVANEGSAVWEVNSGRDGVLVAMNRMISRESVYNIVIATGEPVGEEFPVRGVAEDTDPASPTNVDSAFGRVPRFFSSSFLTTTGQANSAARSILASSTGLPYLVELGSVPNPAIEGWDVVTVRYTDRLRPETHVLDSIYYPLSIDEPMVMTSRKQF